MKKKLYLHIGANKTGSSAIQLFLVKNREKLEETGYCYPKYGELHNAHYNISSAFGCGPSVEGVDFKTLSKKLYDECGQNSCILSSEYFITAKNAEGIYNSLSKDFDIEVIVYLRRHDLWYESLYNQAVKTVANPPWGKGIESYLNFQWKKGGQTFDYLQIIKIWNAFEDMKLTVRPYEKESFLNGDIFEDFMEAIGISKPDVFDTNVGVINESIPLEYLDLVDSVNRSEALSVIEKNRIIRAVKKIEQGKSKFKYSMTPAHKRKVISNQSPNYDKICEILGIEKPLFKNVEVKEDLWIAPSRFDIEQSIAIMNRLIRSYE